MKTWIFSSSNVIITKIFRWIQAITALANSKDILSCPRIALQDLRSRSAAKMSLEVYFSNAANADYDQLNTIQKDISGQNICSATVSSSLLLLFLFDRRYIFPWLPSENAVIQEKRHTRYGFFSSKRFSKRLAIDIFSLETSWNIMNIDGTSSENLIF